MKIIGAKVYNSEHIFEEKTICTAAGRIAEQSDDDVQIDGTGLYAIPGLVDIHFHGALGHDFCDADPEGLEQIAAYEASNGVLAICPATMTFDEERLGRVMENASEFASSHNNDTMVSSLVGINMEGPFISKAKIGAQNPEYLHLPDVGMFNRLQEKSGGLIKLVDIAPELVGSMEFIDSLHDSVNISLAHTAAGYTTACTAFSHGARHVTHLYNAMPGISHREPGPIIAAMENEAEAEIIADGVHVHSSMVRFAFRMFGKDKICLISDSMEATGLQDGEYQLGGQSVTVTGNRAVLTEDRNIIAGSVTNLFNCMKIAVQRMGIPFEAAIRAASENPAKAIGVDKDYGSIAIGKYANIVLVDENLDIKRIINRGRVLLHD